MDHRICAIGDLTVDVILHGLSSMPQWGEELEINRATKRLGGNVGNMAVGAGALHTDLIVVADVGDDEGGKFVVQQIKECGLDTRHIREFAHMATSQSYACIRGDGERFLLPEKGTLEKIEATVMQEDIPASQVIFLGGWCLPPRVCVEYVVPRLRQWKEKGSVLSTDLIWSEESWEKKQELLRFLNYFDLVFMNEKELLAVTECEERDAAIAKLRSLLALDTREDAAGIIKLGAEGACMVTGDDVIYAVPLPCKPADTVGAGDLFNLGFLHAKYQLRQSWKQAIDFAVAFASLSISQYGKSKVTQEAVYHAMQQNTEK